MSENQSKPWASEPNEVFFKHLGVPCMIIRHRSLGTLCGYARLPTGPLADLVRAEGRKVRAPLKFFKGTSYHKKSSFAKVKRQPLYDANILRGVEVHGGLTYGSAPGHHYRMRRGVWVGFDCAHAGDFIPFMEQFLPKGSSLFKEDCYADIEFVTGSLHGLVAQLLALHYRLLEKKRK